jgi:hypothetical protein
MIDEKKQSKASADPDLVMETESEADPILKLSEGRASRLQNLIGGLVAIVIMAWCSGPFTGTSDEAHRSAGSAGALRQEP